MTQGEEILSLLRRRIARRKRITYSEFMSTALYEPGLGRYRLPHPPMGPGGDYITSPEVDEAFGRLVGRALREMFERMRPPSGSGPVRIIEVGPGRGTLCRDLLQGMAEEAPELHGAVRYTLVESSPALRAEQGRLLSGDPACRDRVEWASWEELSAGPPLTGCILANEFLDALPVHLVEWSGGRIQEIFVTTDPSGRLVEELGEPTLRALGEYFQHLGITLGEGQRAEVNLEALRWTRQAASVLERGYLLVVDYGHEAPELFSELHHGGTLVGYRKHQLVTDPLETPGHQDLTSHVDFTSVVAEALAAGFTGSAMTTQRNLLICTGLATMIAGLAERGPEVAEGERVRKRFALHSLMSPSGMGTTFKVLVLGKGAPVEGLRAVKDPFREPVEGLEDGVYYSSTSRRTAPPAVESSEPHPRQTQPQAEQKGETGRSCARKPTE